ncbi:MAG: proline dehydrogenase family protein [Chloroflexi bacterium]|nr:proline dehydrogenase family protein [Chloroflexota bacterium]
MWRTIFLALAPNETLRRLLIRSGFGKQFASRFVAGETIGEAMSAAAELTRRGAAAELDYLGEHVTNEAQAAQAASTYLDMLDRIVGAGVETQVSFKPSQMGLELGDDLCYDNCERVVERAAQHNNFVWMDMEGSDSTERTIQIYKKLRASYDNVGIAIQAYLYRSKADVEALIAIGGTVRLCKGAYNEGADVAFPHKRDVDNNFKRLTEVLLSSGHYHAIASHDEKMLNHAIEIASARGLSNEAFEFQMLYGIRRDLQAKLVRDGHRVRVYIPYGEQWYPYLMRRLAERPANLLFLLKAVITEMRAKKRMGLKGASR